MPEETTQYNTSEEKKESTAVWNPSEPQKERIKFVYEQRAEMVTLRDQSYVQFNDRTLKEFIDDSEKRLNAYVLDKASQGKEEWQANFATRAYANKAKALLAATARDIPGIRIKAVNFQDRFDHFAAEIAMNLVRHSYNQGNPQEDLFFLAWSNVGKGTVLSYEGYEKQTYEKTRIKSFDLVTGDIEEEIMEKESYGEPVSYEVSLMKCLIKNFYIRDIQEQPALIHETYYAERERFDDIFEKYPNALAELLLLQLKKLERYTKQRREISKLYGKDFAYLRYPVLVEDPQAVRAKAKKQGIFLGNWYHNVVDPADAGYRKGSCPKAEEAARHIINLPTRITPAEAKRVLDIL